LRGSGSLEQDANVVIGLYRRDAYETGTEDANTAEVGILKNRSGKTGPVRLSWNGPSTRFDNFIGAQGAYS